jgi:hypothetical protein
MYFGLTVGLVYLTKASLAYYLIPIFFVDVVFRNLHLLRQNQTRLQAAIAICRQCITCGFSTAILPFLWLCGAYFQQGWTFLHYFLFSSDQGVAQLSIAQLSPVYLGYMRDSIGIWFGIAAIVGYTYMTEEFKKHVNEILYGTFLLTLLVLSPAHANWYLMPLFPFAALDLTRLAGPRLAPVYEAALYERASAYFKGDERASADAQKQIAEKVIRDFSFEKASGEEAEEAKRDWLRITVAKINGSSGL